MAVSGVTNVTFCSVATKLFAQDLRILAQTTGQTRSVGDETITYDTLTLQILPPISGGP